MYAFATHDGTLRKNPIINQIDFFITRNSQKKLIMNSKSYRGINIDTDHKMVIASMILDDYEIARSKTKGEPKTDTSIFTDVDNQNRYRNATNILTFLLGIMHQQSGKSWSSNAKKQMEKYQVNVKR